MQAVYRAVTESQIASDAGCVQSCDRQAVNNAGYVQGCDKILIMQDVHRSVTDCKQCRMCQNCDRLVRM